MQSRSRPPSPNLYLRRAGCDSLSVSVRAVGSVVTMQVDDQGVPEVSEQMFANIKDEVLDLHVSPETSAVPYYRHGIVQCYSEFTDVVSDFHHDANVFTDTDFSLADQVQRQHECTALDNSVMDLHVNRDLGQDIFTTSLPIGVQGHLKVEGIEKIPSANRGVVGVRENQIIDCSNKSGMLPVVHRNYWEVDGLDVVSSGRQEFTDVTHASRVHVDQKVVVVKQETKCQVRIQDAIQEIHKILMIQRKDVQPTHTMPRL